MPETGIFTPINTTCPIQFQLSVCRKYVAGPPIVILRLIDNMLQGIQRTSPNPAGTDILYQA